MAYGVYTDVQGLLPERMAISNESYPTLTTVNSWLDQYSGEVDVALAISGAAVIPIDAGDTAKYNMTKLKVTQRVAYQYMLVKSTNRDPQRKPYWEDYKKDFDAFIENVMKGIWPLAAGADSLPSSRTMDAETNNDPTMQPRFSNDREY